MIRAESENDYSEISRINDLAFGQNSESNLICSLRKTENFISDLSMVAEKDNQVVGHILFYPVKINSSEGNYISLALAPMSVLPDYQNKGIGSMLVKEGLKRAKELKYKSVVVLGHPEYYPKFGFEPSVKWGIKSSYDVPDNVYMALELEKGSLVAGIVEYPQEFNEV